MRQHQKKRKCLVIGHNKNEMKMGKRKREEETHRCNQDSESERRKETHGISRQKDPTLVEIPPEPVGWWTRTTSSARTTIKERKERKEGVGVGISECRWKDDFLLSSSRSCTIIKPFCSSPETKCFARGQTRLYHNHKTDSSRTWT